MVIPYNGYNSYFPDEFVYGGYVGTITTESPRFAFRHGWKIVEIYEVDDEDNDVHG